MDDMYRSLADALAHADHCRVLVLEVSDGDAIDAAITDLPRLERLVVKGGSDVQYPAGLGAMESLTSVMFQTEMARLPDFIYELPNLESLRVSWAEHLEEIDERAADMEALRTLILTSATQECLSDLHHFDRLDKLEISPAYGIDSDELDFSGIAQIDDLRRLVYSSTDVPESINELHQIEELKIDGYGTLTLPDRLDGLSSLVKLWIGPGIDGSVEQIFDLGALEELVIRKAKKEPLELPEKGWARLESFRVLTIFPELAKIPEQFGQFGSLEELYVRLEAAATIPAPIFECSTLRELNFSVGISSEIDVADAPFSRLPELEVVDLTISKATAFPMELCELQNLRELTLGFNSFEEIPDEIGQLENLRSLELKLDHGIRHFPAGILKLHRLEHLELNGSIEEPMPAEFSELARLETLNLRGWRFEALPPDFTQLINLEALSVRQGALCELPADIGALSGLRTLNLFEHELSELPESIGELRQLTELELSRSSIEHLPETIGHLESLEKLDLSNNPLRELPETIGRLENLERLDLSNSQLASLPAAMGELRSLTHLTVADSPLTAFPAALFELPALEYLQARKANIASLPESVGAAPALTHLVLSDNCLSNVPKSLVENQTLEQLYLDGNEFSQAAASALAPLDERLGRQLRKPRVSKEIAIPTTVSQARLAPAVLDQLERLGASVESPEQIPDTEGITFPFGDYPVPEAIRQLHSDIRWPRESFAGAYRGRKAWMVTLGIGWDHSQYECVHNHPYLGFAEMDGGNYAFLVRLDDPNPSDPVVYRVDHEAYAESHVPQFGASRSGFLAGLNPE